MKNQNSHIRGISGVIAGLATTMYTLKGSDASEIGIFYEDLLQKLCALAGIPVTKNLTAYALTQAELTAFRMTLEDDYGSMEDEEDKAPGQ